MAGDAPVSPTPFYCFSVQVCCTCEKGYAPMIWKFKGDLTDGYMILTLEWTKCHPKVTNLANSFPIRTPEFAAAQQRPGPRSDVASTRALPHVKADSGSPEP